MYQLRIYVHIQLPFLVACNQFIGIGGVFRPCIEQLANTLAQYSELLSSQNKRVKEVPARELSDLLSIRNHPSVLSTIMKFIISSENIA